MSTILRLIAASSASEGRVVVAVGCNQRLFGSQSLPISPGSRDSQSLMPNWRCISAILGFLQFLNILFQASMPLCMLPRTPSSHSLLHLTYSCFKVYLRCHFFKEVFLDLLTWVWACPCLGFHQKCDLRQRHMGR